MKKRQNESSDVASMAFDILARLLVHMRISAYVLSVYAMVQGIMIIIGGEQRFSAVAYSTALLVPGAPQSWGWFLAFAGTLSFAGIKNRSYRLGMTAMTLAGVWSMFFAIAFLVSALEHEQANVTAVAVYTKDAILFLLTANAQRILAKYPAEQKEE